MLSRLVLRVSTWILASGQSFRQAFRETNPEARKFKGFIGHSAHFLNESSVASYGRIPDGFGTIAVAFAAPTPNSLAPNAIPIPRHLVHVVQMLHDLNQPENGAGNSGRWGKSSRGLEVLGDVVLVLSLRLHFHFHYLALAQTSSTETDYRRPASIHAQLQDFPRAAELLKSGLSRFPHSEKLRSALSEIAPHQVKT